MCKNDRTAVPHKILNNGVEMPMVGLGVYNISSHETQRVVEEAIAEGYRSIDTAAMYHNEDGVGTAVRSSGVPRQDLRALLHREGDDAHNRNLDEETGSGLCGPDAAALACGKT